jgi:cobalt-zinc-cadmium resistance protein CzcA
MPVDAYPDLSPPRVELIVQWPGHAAEEVERLITLPLELAMNGAPQLSVMRSISLYGLSDLRLTRRGRGSLLRTPDYFRTNKRRHFRRVSPSACFFSPSSINLRPRSPDRSPWSCTPSKVGLERAYRRARCRR